MNRNSFEPYLLSDDKENNLWNSAIFVFDSSALLDIYFLPKSARSKIYCDIFDKLQNRLWIPFHVQFEYFNNRENIITKPIKEKYAPIREKIKYFGSVGISELSKKIDEISRETKKDDKHPYVNQAPIDQFKSDINEFNKKIKEFECSVLKDIESAEKEITDVAKNDDVLEALEKSFQVGREFSFDEILEITKEGKHRYEYKIPPGYGDYYKKEKKGIQIFGDLIIWKQILEFAKAKQLPIIFITNDIKKDEDWCYLDKKATEDRILCPREELTKEIKDFARVEFWMYNLPLFLYNANKYLKADIKEDVILNFAQVLNSHDKKGNFLIFRCDQCGKIHKYNKLDVSMDFQCIGGSERSMGVENQYRAEECFDCNCGNEINVIFEIWEYPVGVQNYDSVEAEGAKILETYPLSMNFSDDDNDGFYPCHECDGNKENVGNYVDFHYTLPLDNEYDSSSSHHTHHQVIAGNCQWCNTLHIKCPSCKTVTSINTDNELIECESGCGLTFFKKSDYDPDGGDEFTLKLVDHRKVKCSACGKMFVDDEHIGVCRECDLRFNFE